MFLYFTLQSFYMFLTNIVNIFSTKELTCGNNFEKEKSSGYSIDVFVFIGNYYIHILFYERFVFKNIL